MARFPIDESKLPSIGAALAKAVTEPAARASLHSDPRAYLVASGVDSNAIAGLNLKVVEDTATDIHIVIPSKIDEGRVNRGDQDYLIEMGKTVVLNCGF